MSVLDNFLLVARQVATLFVLIGAGAICARAKLVDAFSIRGIVNVLILLVTPMLIVEVFQRPYDPALLAQLGCAFALAAAAHGALILLARLTARGDERTRPVLELATVFSNAGFMGIPLEQAILGETGVFFGIVYVAMFNLFIWSWGLSRMRRDRGRGFFSPRTFVNPGTVGLAVGLGLFLTSTRLPSFLGEPVRMLSDLNTPLAMIVIGYYLAHADLKGVLRLPAAHTAAFLRLVAFPILFLGALAPFQRVFDRTMMLALLIGAATPVAAMVTMFASKYDRDVELSVGLVSGTTLLSLVTLPVVIALGMTVL